MAAPRIIDVHHHITPPQRLVDMRARGAGERPTLDWTLEKSLAMMDAGGIATAMISIPNIYQGDRGVIRTLARHCNEHAARIVADHPGRFGLFACLPLPDVDAALREIEHAFDTLKADGVGIMTSFENAWLGDPLFAPVLDELNRRKAITFVHPLAAECCRGILPVVSDATIEYETDTTRAIASLMFGGTIKRCPDIRFIFSHGGGTLPSVIERFVLLPRMRPALAAALPEGPEAMVRRFHYDIAQSAHRVPLGALINLVSTAQILFGTDFPYRTAIEHSDALRAAGLGAHDIAAIERGNALKLLPRLDA
jgi:predicted TIM-barrel fold metal-dependent hydrolase